MLVWVSASDAEPGTPAMLPSVWPWAELSHYAFLSAVEISGGSSDNRCDAFTRSALLCRRLGPGWKNWVDVRSGGSPHSFGCSLAVSNWLCHRAAQTDIEIIAAVDEFSSQSRLCNWIPILVGLRLDADMWNILIFIVIRKSGCALAYREIRQPEQCSYSYAGFRTSLWHIYGFMLHLSSI